MGSTDRVDENGRSAWKSDRGHGTREFRQRVFSDLPSLSRLRSGEPEGRSSFLSAWVSAVQSFGFDLVDWVGHFRYLVPGGPYLLRRSRRLKKHCPAVMIIARKPMAS
jgi:hypothetical protein